MVIRSGGASGGVLTRPGMVEERDRGLDWEEDDVRELNNIL